MNTKIRLLPVVSFLAISIAMRASPNPTVTVVGRLREVMLGDSTAKVRLNDLDLTHVYAVGPIAEMDGEITIADGRISLARVQADGSIAIDHKPSTNAAFLVYSHVKGWHDVKIPSSVITALDLERFVETSAKQMGFDTEAPLPFLIKGAFKDITFHVIRKVNAGMSPHSNQANFTEHDISGRIVGFFSKHHQGIFTHHDSFVHMHLDAESVKFSGHVESLAFSPTAECTLLLPSSD